MEVKNKEDYENWSMSPEEYQANIKDKKLMKDYRTSGGRYKVGYLVCSKCGELSWFRKNLENPPFCLNAIMPLCFGCGNLRNVKKISQSLYEELENLESNKLRAEKYASHIAKMER